MNIQSSGIRLLPVILSAVLCACGQKGPLYFPEPAQELKQEEQQEKQDKEQTGE